MALEIGRLQRQEFGRPAFLLKLEGWARRLIRRPRHKTIHVGAADAAASADSATVKVTRAPAVTLEERVSRLERVEADLRRELEQETRVREQAVEGVVQRVGKLEGDLARERHKQEEARRASLRRQITTQTRSRPSAGDTRRAMSREENVEIALRWTAAINARQVPEELLAPDVRLENVTTAVTDRTYRGPEGVRRWFSDIFDVLDADARYEAEVVEAGDDYVVAKARFVGRGSVSGAPVEMRYYGVAWIRHGKIIRGVGYPTRREALEAVGLRE